MVDFEPGMMTRSASAGIGVPGRTTTTETPGSSRSGSRSSKLAIRGNAGTATTSAAFGFVEPARPRTSSDGSAAASGNHGIDAERRPAGPLRR